MTAPKLNPAMVTEIARPLFLTNHLAIDETVELPEQPNPAPISSPQIRYACHRALICDISIKPVPSKMPAVMVKNLGPYLSVNLPEITARIPVSTEPTEKAPERAPLFQPNCSVSGFKNTPKPKTARAFVAKTKKPMMTATQP